MDEMHPPRTSILLEMLKRIPLKYSSVTNVYHYIEISHLHTCGVFGDGDNGCYEWFTWNDGTMETSDVAYGSPEIALRDVLNKILI